MEYEEVKCHKLLVRGERISVIAAMTTEGVLDLTVVRGTVAGICSLILFKGYCYLTS